MPIEDDPPAAAADVAEEDTVVDKNVDEIEQVNEDKDESQTKEIKRNP